MSYLELLKKLGNTQNGNPQNPQNSEPDHALSLPGDISPGRGGSEGFEGTASGGFEKNSALQQRPANESDAQAQGVFEGRIDILVMYGVIDREAGDVLVQLRAQHTDLGESKLAKLEGDNGLTRCGRCIHARKPGATAHCSNDQRTDLERAYGFLKVFPQDAGLSCRYWERRYD